MSTPSEKNLPLCVPKRIDDLCIEHEKQFFEVENRIKQEEIRHQEEIARLKIESGKILCSYKNANSRKFENKLALWCKLDPKERLLRQNTSSIAGIESFVHLGWKVLSKISKALEKHRYKDIAKIYSDFNKSIQKHSFDINDSIIIDSFILFILFRKEKIKFPPDACIFATKCGFTEAIFEKNIERLKKSGNAAETVFNIVNGISVSTNRRSSGRDYMYTRPQQVLEKMAKDLKNLSILRMNMSNIDESVFEIIVHYAIEIHKKVSDTNEGNYIFGDVTKEQARIILEEALKQQ